MTTIGLLGDVMLGRGVAARLRDVAPAELWSGDLRSLCASFDALVCNLECCVSERGEETRRVPGKPFFFRAPPEAVESLRVIGTRAVSLANNHTLDYEEEAGVDTLVHLTAAGIAAAGAGDEVGAARRGTAFEAGGIRIGLVSVSDHPAEYAAGRERFGIAHADLERGVPGWLTGEIAALRERCDAVIAFPHWGPNMSTQPAPWQRRAAAALQAAGANLVAGHSAHVFHGIGWTQFGPIAFDLGDALDDYAVDPLLRNDLGLLAIWRPDAIENPGEAELELVGLKLEFCRTEIAAGADADWIEARLASASAPLGAQIERIAEARFLVLPGAGQ